MKTIKKIIAIFSFLVCFMFFARCSRETAPILKTDEKIIIQKDTTIVFDTIIKVRADSSLMLLYAECDSNNNILLSELIQKRNERAKIRYVQKDNYIYIDCFCDSLEFEVEEQKTINKYITEQYTKQTQTIKEKDSFIKCLGCVCIGMLAMLILMLIFTLKK